MLHKAGGDVFENAKPFGFREKQAVRFIGWRGETIFPHPLSEDSANSSAQASITTPSLSSTLCKVRNRAVTQDRGPDAMLFQSWHLAQRPRARA